MSQSWTIGSAEGCDLVVDLPGVSGRHCRLVQDELGYLLEDLGSTNGTFVRGMRLVAPIRVALGDAILLGRSAPMPWPVEGPTSGKVYQVGRDPENDIVIDLPMISGRHARIVWDTAAKAAWIEDLGSANGTAIGAPGRVPGRQAFTHADTIYLGTRPVSGAWVLERIGIRDEVQAVAADSRGLPSPGPALTSPSPRPVRDSPPPPPVPVLDTSLPLPVRSSSSRRLVREWPVGAVWVQSIVIALAIAAVAEFGGGASRAATIASLLAVAAVWLGLSAAVLDRLADRDRGPGSLDGADPAATFARLPSLAVACVGACILAWGIVAVISGLQASASPAIGFMVLASAAGLALGGVIVAASPGPKAMIAASVVAITASGFLGGAVAPSRAVAAATPSRWAFEGLLLLEAGSGPAKGRDPAEGYFPAESARSGVAACTMALAFMVAGLAGAAAFIAWGPKLAAGPRS